MKKLSALILPIVIAVSLTACGNDAKNSSSAANSTSDSVQSSASGGFRVEGTKLLDANGNEFVMRGINHAHTWFRDDDETAIPAIAKTGSNVVRLVFADGDQWERDTFDNVSDLIDLCKENQLIAVVEVHDGTGMDDVSYLENAANFWIEMKDALIGNEDYVILNIANEWTGSWDSAKWSEGYTSVIPKIREAGIKNTIMVDAGGWGQYGESIKAHGADVFEADPDRNTMFSVHMYGTAGKNKRTIKKNLEGVTDQNLCVCVGEFGYTHSDGDVDEAYIMQYCQENSIGYMGWSWKGNGGGVEYLDIAKRWDGSELSSDWGEVLINGENGIKATSKKCTVFS